MAEFSQSCKKLKTHHSGCNPFSALPRDCVVNVLQCLNSGPQHLARLASCDRFLQTLLFDEMTFLWERLDFTGNHHRMTDSRLHSFLIRVHAVHVTQELLLRGQRVTGTGLLPLMNSEVLSRIDLRVRKRGNAVTGTGLDEPVVAAVLTSMLPHRLEAVRFHGPEYVRNMTYTWGAFVSRLNLKLVDQLIEENTHCGYCHRSLSQHTEQFQFDSILGLQLQAKCGKCGIVSCRQVGRSDFGCPGLQTCEDCDDAFCRACASGCSQCYNVACNDCANDVYSCICCEEEFCSANCFIESCHSCKDFFCEECYEENCRSCAECSQGFCLSCQPRRRGDECANCGAWFCRSDAAMSPPRPRCDFCGQDTLCRGCSKEHKCVPPWHTPFEIDPEDNWTLCNCGRNRVQGSGVFDGQDFICCYTTRQASNE